MKNLHRIVIALFLLFSMPSLAQESQSFDDLVKSCVSALQQGDQGKFMAQFIDEDALVRSIVEDSYPDNPKEKKATAKRMATGGKERILRALRDAKASTWSALNPPGFDWKKAVITDVQPSYNRSDGIEKTDWARISLKVGDEMYLIKMNQARKTKNGWKLVFGGKLKGPRPAAETEE